MKNLIKKWLDLDHELLDHDIVACEICKCLIIKENAIKGKSEVRTENFAKLYGLSVFASPICQEEFIYTPYYCRRCKPKK